MELGISKRNAALLAVLAGIVSGISIYFNKLAITGFSPMVFSFLKNAFVAMALLALILFAKKFKEIRKLNFGQWKRLFLIGIVGGSVPFLLFFYGLKLTSAFNAGFIQKTLFVFVSLLAFAFLREKIDRRIMLAMAGMLAGIIAISGFGFTAFGFGDLLIAVATLLWAIEIILSKKALENLGTETVVFGRMLFGAIIMLAFLVSTGNISLATAGQILSLQNGYWLAITGAMLLAYVLLLYCALKHEKASIVTALLLVGAPITAVLSSAGASALGIAQGMGIGLVLAGTLFLLYRNARVSSQKVVQ